MSIRDKMLQKPAIAVGLAAAAMLLSAVLFVMNAAGNSKARLPDRVYYFDLESGQVFDAPASDLPVDAPAGGAGQGVQAKVYSCGRCTASEWKVAYLQSLTPAAMKIVQQGKPAPTDEQAVLAYSTALSDGQVVAELPASGAEPTWMPVASPQGAALLNQWRQECGGAAHACMP